MLGALLTVQYRRVANIYFTLVAALSLTEFSPVRWAYLPAHLLSCFMCFLTSCVCLLHMLTCVRCCRPWTTWTPLVIVLGVAMIKEAIEDYKRYRADKEVNHRPVEVMDPATGHFAHKRWMDVVVGDVLIVKADEFFAADVLFLTAENEEGTCYVETMNLDGETNLKIKKALDQTKDFGHQTLEQFNIALIECEAPNARLYQFKGNLLIPRPEPAPAPETGETEEEEKKRLFELIPINPAAVILRGCKLRNTARVYGAVVYAGGLGQLRSSAAAST